MEEEIRVPIYFMAGFLESGKSTFLDFTIEQEYFQIDGPTLLILCEEGEVEFDPKKLKKSRTSVEVLNSIEAVSYTHLRRPACTGRWSNIFYLFLLPGHLGK